MQQYITELSKYIIAALMVLYTLGSFVTLTCRGKNYKAVYLIQNLLMFAVQLLMFMDMALVNKNMEYIFFYVFVQIFLFAVVLMIPMIYEEANRVLMNQMCMLLGIGLCIVSRLSFKSAVKQYIIVLVSLAVSIFLPWLLTRIRFLKKLTWGYGLGGVALLAMVFILGEITHGSKISLTVGGITFQPSEFVKILFVFFLAGALWEKADFLRVALTAVIAGVHVILLVVSKDLGSALIFFIGYVFVVFLATGNYLYLLAGALGGSGAAWAAYRLFGHVRTRVLAWKDPWTYIDDQGYAVTQSLFAIGSDNWFGMGLSQGDPKAIPYVEMDFVFSAICEELGVIFGICVILLYFVCFLEMLKMAILIRDRFYQLIVCGIGIMYIFQIFLTIGGGIKLIPLTGVTLPFISYGGSSVMTTMIMFFLIQGIYIRLQQEGARHSGGKTKQKSKKQT
ncbi:MAG: FtsW/RodA/SpoVE family cell cycle protein [Lachnospiraceae bacterium]|nr:FtsW/RodA/SpoVE family cell cycle protein [uncultured Acetatifactor sp.]MCI8287589.1 FtsW/RodA/SpoVE family cell cycle protein [Lachnospiraceae bacterium]